MDVKGKVVVVTGGASGLGGATAQRIVELGGKVLIADVNDKLGTEFAEQLGAAARFVRCDVTAEADAQTRSFAARVALNAADAGEVVLGQSARVYVARPDRQLSVPLAAVQGQPGSAQAQVMLVDPASGSLKAARVQVARWGAERAELSAGVSPGQWVVAAGGHLLQPGQQVRAVDRDNRPLQAAPAAAAATEGTEP